MNNESKDNASSIWLLQWGMQYSEEITGDLLACYKTSGTGINRTT